MITVDPSRAIIRFFQIQENRAKRLNHQAQAAGAKMVQYAKRHRPWTDRTRSARDTIASSTEWRRGKLKISLTIGINYGIYLEFVQFKHKGRLSIFWPTINAHRAEVLRSFAASLGRPGI